MYHLSEFIISQEAAPRNILCQKYVSRLILLLELQFYGYYSDSVSKTDAMS